MVKKTDFVLGCLLGLLVALYFYGLKIIDPHNVQWILKGGDSYQHFIGWAFFKNDIWRWPLGLNPHFGSEINGSIVFTDSIPLLSIILKLLLPPLSAPIQFFGLAVMINYMLTGGVLVLILKKLMSSTFVSLMIALLLVSSTIMTIRGIGGHGHESLTAHWTFLYAMYLLLDGGLKESRFSYFKWAALLALTVLIHFYLFVLCLPFFVAAHIQHFIHNKHLNWPRLLLKQCLTIILTMSVVLGLMYAVGYFVLPIKSSLTSEYGSYPASLLTFINPASSAWFLNMESSKSLSGFFSGFSSAIAGQYEGQAYLGLGLIVLLNISFVSLLIRRVSLLWALPMAGVCFLLSFIALSNHVSLYDQFVIYDLPPQMVAWLGMVRASGRLIWPMFYLLVILAGFILSKNFSTRSQVGILLLVAILQIGDLSAWHRSLRARNHDYSNVHIDHLKSNQAFKTMISHAKSIVLLPADYVDDYQAYSWEALRAGIPINTGYYARNPSPEFFAKINIPQLEKIKRCDLSSGVLYILRRFEVKACPGQDVLHTQYKDTLWMIKTGG